MKYSILSFVLAILLSGCGYRHSENVDPNQAEKVLRTALEAWKEGKKPAELEPTIIVNESDWLSGNRLLDFKMNDSGALDGRQVRWVVQIKLQDKSGKALDRKATYIIDTVPRVVIVRDSFAS